MTKDTDEYRGWPKSISLAIIEGDVAPESYGLKKSLGDGCYVTLPAPQDQ
jgi:hypothetical protein